MDISQLKRHLEMAGKKTCTECNAVNRATAKFCAQCGAALPRQDADTTVCGNCGEANPASAKFCYDCGNALNTGKSKKPQTDKSKYPGKNRKTAASKQSGPTVIIVGAAIAAALIYFLITDNQAPQRGQSFPSDFPVSEKKLSDPVLENRVMEIASKFICSCGGCGEDPLDECDCETARSERNYIRQAVASGQNADDIIRAVNLKYGWIKPRFKDKYGPGKPVVDLNKKQIIPALPSSSGEQDFKGQRLASLADRFMIISKFACPCGQCSIDELKDCECSHPRGAQEVKQFIDKKIAAAQYSIASIINSVEKRYGNRIR